MYWIVLIAGAILALIYVVVKIRHNQLATSDAVFWFLLALVLIVMALFPQVVYFFSNALGFESPANFVFLCMLAIVIFRQLTVSVENARLRNKIVQLTQTIALSRTCDSVEESLGQRRGERAKANEIVAECLHDGNVDDCETALTLHDWIIDTVAYDQVSGT